MIARSRNVGDPALREVRVMTVGKALLVAVERERRRVVYASHGVAWGEWRDLARTATVGGGDVGHHVV